MAGVPLVSVGKALVTQPIHHRDGWGWVTRGEAKERLYWGQCVQMDSGGNGPHRYTEQR